MAESSTVVASDSPAMLLSTTKNIDVRYTYEKYTEEGNFKKRDVEDDIYQIPYGCYFEDMLDVERKKDELAPKLSSHFLRENVNAERRKVIVQYLIRIGVHCNYSSHIIHQTIRLFDVIIHRISVETGNIQLIALACLWISLKKEATINNVPSATTIL
ncbi:uncharacterized protein LOC113561392 [Ooceraea biroi]|uniref:Cyclin N-terminal domain-containing protein n=1 Tax=Ooceraea biroi TaxID=2015173 RepID=A0A026W1R0_OOCBI|nr:uncharacterized protein LOC105285036 [Ooceraea biroi]XP_019889056.1 uncharacterized protein LOC105285036 [Ooceraea biroi]XP_026828001.1 uncharacterized protein LOC113561392 [Ooceraea biroi]EZA48994.1 hypothetical protein X777_12845 [Ooceraea biroi]